MKRNALVFVIASLGLMLLIIQGCASFPGNKLQQVSSFPPLTEVEKQKTVSYALAAEIDLFGKVNNPLSRSIAENELADVVRESGYFTAWGSGINGEVAINAKFVNSGNPAAMIPAFITGLTLYIVPSWATDTFTLTAKVKTQDGKEYSYELEDTSTLVQWLPMVFVPGSMIEVPLSVRKNIWKNLILKMRQDGVFKSSDASNSKK
ncbi:MAG: hypothetical protein ACYDGO_07815 [Smithellaceae bacterium]